MSDDTFLPPEDRPRIWWRMGILFGLSVCVAVLSLAAISAVERRNEGVERVAACVEREMISYEVEEGLRSPDGSPPREIPDGARPWSPADQKRAYERCLGSAP